MQMIPCKPSPVITCLVALGQDNRPEILGAGIELQSTSDMVGRERV